MDERLLTIGTALLTVALRMCVDVEVVIVGPEVDCTKITCNVPIVEVSNAILLHIRTE